MTERRPIPDGHGGTPAIDGGVEWDWLGLVVTPDSDGDPLSPDQVCSVLTDGPRWSDPGSEAYLHGAVGGTHLQLAFFRRDPYGVCVMYSNRARVPQRVTAMGDEAREGHETFDTGEAIVRLPRRFFVSLDEASRVARAFLKNPTEVPVGLHWVEVDEDTDFLVEEHEREDEWD
jgi:hypothetical protein